MKKVLMLIIFLSCSNVYSQEISQKDQEIIYKSIFLKVKLKNPDLNKEQIKQIADEIWYVKMRAEYDNKFIKSKEPKKLDNPD